MPPKSPLFPAEDFPRIRRDSFNFERVSAAYMIGYSQFASARYTCLLRDPMESRQYSLFDRVLLDVIVDKRILAPRRHGN